MNQFKMSVNLVALISIFLMVGTNGTSPYNRRTKEDSTFPLVTSGSSSLNVKIENDAENGGTNHPPSSTTIRPTTTTTTDLPPPADTDVISRVNLGVSTILGGVRTGSLEQILRGSFLFTRNENVKSVANNVLDNLFPKSVTPTSSQPTTASPTDFRQQPQATKTLENVNFQDKSPLELKRLELELEERKETVERLAERIQLLEEKNKSLREEIIRSKVTKTGTLPTIVEAVAGNVKTISTDVDPNAFISSTTETLQS